MNWTVLRLIVYVFALHSAPVKGPLVPNGTVPLDCGSQQVFTCTVGGRFARWRFDIKAGNVKYTATVLPDTARTNQTKSVITVFNLSEADNNGTVECIDRDTNLSEGTARIVIGKPPCPKVKAYAIEKKTMAAVAVTWEENDRIPVTNTLVRYCTSTSPNCSTTVACTQGRGTGCILYGLDTEKWYIFTVTANNNCGAATGFKENVYIAITKHKPTVPAMEACPSSLTATILVGVFTASVLLMGNVATVVTVYCVTRHCCMKTPWKKPQALPILGDIQTSYTLNAIVAKKESDSLSVHSVETIRDVHVNSTDNQFCISATAGDDVRMSKNPSYETQMNESSAEVMSDVTYVTAEMLHDVGMTQNPSYNAFAPTNRGITTMTTNPLYDPKTADDVVMIDNPSYTAAVNRDNSLTATRDVDVRDDEFRNLAVIGNDVRMSKNPSYKAQMKEDSAEVMSDATFMTAEMQNGVAMTRNRSCKTSATTNEDIVTMTTNPSYEPKAAQSDEVVMIDNPSYKATVNSNIQMIKNPAYETEPTQGVVEMSPEYQVQATDDDYITANPPTETNDRIGHDVEMMENPSYKATWSADDVDMTRNPSYQSEIIEKKVQMTDGTEEDSSVRMMLNPSHRTSADENHIKMMKNPSYHDEATEDDVWMTANPSYEKGTPEHNIYVEWISNPSYQTTES